MSTAPSRYEFRSSSEWEQAMNEWCSENEYLYKVRRDGKPVYLSALDVFPKRPILPPYVKRYSPPGHHSPFQAGHTLPGGSRGDYRMAGYKRY